jgi:hypothetical protein
MEARQREPLVTRRLLAAVAFAQPGSPVQQDLEAPLLPEAHLEEAVADSADFGRTQLM